MLATRHGRASAKKMSAVADTFGTAARLPRCDYNPTSWSQFFPESLVRLDAS